MPTWIPVVIAIGKVVLSAIAKYITPITGTIGAGISKISAAVVQATPENVKEFMNKAVDAVAESGSKIKEFVDDYQEKFQEKSKERKESKESSDKSQSPEKKTEVSKEKISIFQKLAEGFQAAKSSGETMEQGKPVKQNEKPGQTHHDDNTTVKTPQFDSKVPQQGSIKEMASKEPEITKKEATTQDPSATPKAKY